MARLTEKKTTNDNTNAEARELEPIIAHNIRQIAGENDA